MASTVSLEGVKKAVFFPFQGRDWGTKMVIGGALNFANFVIPLVPLIALLGYTGQVMKGIITRDEDPQLPEWKDWGVFFLDGIKMFGVLVLYTLPGFLVIAFGYFLWWPILKVNLTGYLLALAFTMGLSFMLLFVMQFLYLTVILCFLLPFVISFLGFFIAQACYSLYAVAYRDGVRMLARSSG